MRKILLGGLLLAVGQLYAVTHTIVVKNNVFEPKELTVDVGDVIEWEWESGFHTTTSMTIPLGANAWDSPMTANATSFSYTIVEEGIYNYKCTPHFVLDMVGTITARPVVTGLTTLEEAGEVYPNPFSDKIVVDNDAYTKYELRSVTDKVVQAGVLDQASINTSELKKGVYVLVLFKNEEGASFIRLIKD